MAAYKPNPCKNCKVHKSICVFLCKDYKEWREEEKERKQIANKVKYIQGELDNQTYSGKAKANKRRGYRW